MNYNTFGNVWSVLIKTTLKYPKHIAWTEFVPVQYTWVSENDKLALTHWGWVTHICVGNLTIIGSDNGLSPERHQAIIWTNAGILLIRPLETNFSEISIEIQTFSLEKIRLKKSSANCCSFHLGPKVLTHWMVQWGDVSWWQFALQHNYTE